MSFHQAMTEYIGREAKPVDKFGHQPRLYALTQPVGKGLTYDDEVVFAAAWLHDLGVFVGHRPEDPEALAGWNNVTYALEEAPKVLKQLDFPESKIPAVLEAIRTHQPAAEPRTLEGIILRDADILEQLGAMGVLRAVCKIGRDSRYPTFTSAVEVLRKSLAELPSQLRLDTSKALAEAKIRALESFLKAVDDESFGALY